MAAEYTLFIPRKDADAASWKVDLEEKTLALNALVKAGKEKHADLELFLTEVVWAALRGDLPVPKVVEFLAKSPVASQDSLQRLFTDVLWLVGFGVSEAPANREMRDEFSSLCTQIESKAVLPRQVLALGLETDSVPATVCQVALLRKKQNQAKTKARYTITRFNLLREHSECYARLLHLLDRLATLEFEPDATEEQVSQSKNVLIEDVVRLIGFSNLCPNRIIGMALDIYERRLLEADPCPLAEPLVDLLRRFPKKRLTEVVVFQLLAHGPAPSAGGKDLKPPPQPTPPSRPSQFLAIASLISLGLVDLDELWTYLDPADSVIKQIGSDLMSKYEDELSSLSKIDLASSSSEKGASFQGDLQAFNQAGHQKFRLAAALISVNDWRSAQKVLLQLQTLCKPVLNHFIRSALSDLLKWLVQPLLRPGQLRSPHTEKPTLETTFGCVRRFSLGLKIPASEGHVPVALQQVTEVNQLLPALRQVLDHLEYFLHTDLHLLTSLWKVLNLTLRRPEKGTSGVAGPAVMDDGLVAVVYRNLLPASSLVLHNASLSELMWSVVSQLSVFQRFLIYSCWETMYDSFMLKFVHEKTKMATKQILKRVVANADRKDAISHQSHFHICKLCHSNPIPCIEVMMRDIEIGFNVNMIMPYVECTNRCSEMTADAMGFVLTRMCSRPITETRVFLNQGDATLSPWLTNLAEFVGRFYKKHPQTDLVGLLSVVTKRINSEVPENGSSSGGMPQKQYKGESLIRVILENLIEFMGGHVTVRDLTPEQLTCLAGGSRLKTESVSYGKREDQTRKERARKLLFEAIVDLGLVPILWYSLSQQRHHFLSEEFSEANSGGGGLKLLALLFDGNHECFLKITEFLAQACTREKYMSLLPAFEEVFTMFEPALAFLVIRHGLMPYGRAMSAAARAAVTAATTESGGASIQLVLPQAEVDTQKDLERVVRLYQPKPLEEYGLSMQFYVTFWRLSLQDIFMPTEGYEKSTGQINTTIRQIEMNKFKMERDKDYAHNRDYKNLKKEGLRLKDFHDKLKEEQLLHKLNHEKVLARLELEKDQWFRKPGPTATSAFVSEMLCPRVLTSYSDAMFCCRFVRLLIKLKTPGFQLLDFYNCWTIMLTQNIRCCSEREAQIFGVFLREMMAYIYSLRKSEKIYEAEMKDNPCFHRNYYEEPANAAIVEFAKYTDISKGHAKWEGRIYKAVRQGLDSEDWMEKRNVLLLLSQSCESFPIVDKYGKLILQCVENMRDKEEMSDIKTLAMSLCVKLKVCSAHWVDKQPESDRAAERKDQSSSGKEEPRSRHGTGVKNPLAMVGTSAAASSQVPAPASKATSSQAPRPASSAAGNGDANGGGEKRPREEVGDGREPKHGKESKEAKDKEGKAKSRDRTEPKVPKEAREPKESRGSEKDAGPKRAVDRGVREKHRDRAKSAGDKDKGSPGAASLKDAAGRGSAAGSGSSVVINLDERPEKRQRRSERDGDSHGAAAPAPAHSDRHSSRHGSSTSARNALAAPDAGSSSRTVTSGSGHDHSVRRSSAHAAGSARHEHRSRR
ncbi:unnamed protein product [Polarella glacialis]|uniref:THO complex subunit 2 n=1 Tax=Polarella glacialis TaxID=89957 RepID=A0A813JL65_POLGL|nr:unnamed protein product [Polarella glacialis]